jgi:uncharacterized membrane protein YoaK (UPF0700 family)
MSETAPRLTTHCSYTASFRTTPGSAGASVPSVEDPLAARLLPFVLSLIAGSVDVIGFLGLDGLFTAHITGNLVVLAAHIVAHSDASVSLVISVPVFIVALAATRLFAARLELSGVAPLSPLLLLQFVLICGFLAIAGTADPRVNANTPGMIVAAMFGVSAMAVQNALVRIALPGAPSTAVLTTNITLLTMDLGDVLLGQRDAGKARDRSKRTSPAVAGFLLGCALGAWFEAAIGLRAFILPVSFALLALALGVFATLHRTFGLTPPARPTNNVNTSQSNDIPSETQAVTPLQEGRG